MKEIILNISLAVPIALLLKFLFKKFAPSYEYLIPIVSIPICVLVAASLTKAILKYELCILNLVSRLTAS
jgi:hypothetical protein